MFVEYGKKHSDTVRKHGAKPVCFMSWAYADKPEMTAELAEAYTKAGNDNDALVIPAGLAFARALEAAARPRAARRRQAAPEPGRHLSRRRDRLCRAVQEIAGRAQIHRRARRRTTAKLLQTVAWETVQEYFQTVQTVAK